MEPKASVKISATRVINVRSGDMEEPLSALLADVKKFNPEVTMSDIVRDSLQAFWPQIRAYHLTRHQSSLPTDELTRLTSVCAKAIDHGLTVDQLEAVVSSALESRLAGKPATAFRTTAVTLGESVHRARKIAGGR